ncbi:MAG TPA: fumarylacetoacetate hydrolase family protein [Steroidobacteraceae bacterium]|nr:fumarylacetoacetate hydrolase family protein [Steroidobacteraceae bacterium]
MKIIRYEHRGQSGIGVMADDRRFIGLLEAAPQLPPTLLGIMALGDGLEPVRRAVQGREPDLSIAAVTLRPFLDRPNALWALALNFKSHIAETGLTTSREFPQVFLRTVASYVGQDEPLLCPPAEIARAFDYEGELGVVIGRAGRHIPIDRALDHVAGYTCVNEGSVREYQIHNRQFGLGKNFEASGSYGPWLMTPDEFGDPASRSVTTRVNGVVRQRAPLDDMLFDVSSVVSYLSQGYELRPGDMIAMGTPGVLPAESQDVEGLNLARQHGPFKIPGLVHMRPGDVVEVEISGLGVLRNAVVADAPAHYRVSSVAAERLPC